MFASVLEPKTAVVLLGVAVFCNLAIKYWQARAAYHKTQKSGECQHHLPPKYPSMIPYWGVVVPFVWDTPAFLQNVTSYAGRLTSLRITVAPFRDIFLFQDQETIKEIWKNSIMMCAGRVHIWALRYLFGFPEKWLAQYAADDSGPFLKPYPGSNVEPHLRIHRLLNHSIDKALTGPGFGPTLQRFRTAMLDQIEGLGTSDDNEWMEIDDLRRLVHNTVGRSLINALFGPHILQINSTLMDDLYEFDQALPWFARRIPKFIMPGIYACRSRLHRQFKVWYTYARTHFKESDINEDGDGDPYWGSNWMRERQKALDIIQDDDALAAGDLGVAWASIANVVSASTMALVHVSNTPDLAASVQDEVRKIFGHQSLAEVDLKKLSNIPLLASIYAETLRLHGKSFTVVSSPVQDIHLGRYRLPKNAMGLINAHVSHMDDGFWNTKNGIHPVGSFWPQRFLTDPNDPHSGPTRVPRPLVKPQDADSKEVSFSLQGLEAAWIPYGGKLYPAHGSSQPVSSLFF
ncbi:hypothetical protein PG999_003894 [Apiospora kogelbergensis]|uniref:Cytochrome P450 n=1 Tax=Apiospora kogelbergensis TaxID=1337665 RepID=A0AAW0R504_9PEZI